MVNFTLTFILDICLAMGEKCIYVYVYKTVVASAAQRRYIDQPLNVWNEPSSNKEDRKKKKNHPAPQQKMEWPEAKYPTSKAFYF